MGAILILGGVVVLLALAVSSKDKKAATRLPDTIVHPDAKSHDVEKLAEKASDPAVKDKLQTTADILREAEKREIRFPKDMRPPSELIPLPKWQEYVKRSVRGAVGTVSQSGAMGLYQMGPKALATIGWVELDSYDRISKWLIPGMTTKRFLSDPSAQYQAFRDYTSLDISTLIGTKNIDYAKNHVPLAGQHATISGLLGLMYYAGRENTERWLKDPAWRDKAPKLTEQYKKFNGLF